MRQMNTILVAVGVPTKEVPGASFALPHSVTVTMTDTRGTVGVPDQTTHEHQVADTQSQAEKAETSTQGSRDVKELAETEETAGGWDIPDISDLLDSLNDTESDSRLSLQNHSSLISEENASTNTVATDLNAQCDALDEADLDNEHVSWSWDDTHWTAENSHE